MNNDKYSVIVDLLRKEILDGKYAAPGKFPSERELVARFGVSRPPVQRALKELKAQGYLTQRQGLGTFVTKFARNLGGAIGLIVPGFGHGEIFTPICRELSRLAQQAGLTLCFGSCDAEDPKERARLAKELARKYAQEHVSGVIFQPIEFVKNMESLNREVTAVFDAENIPVVLIDWDVVPSPGRSEYDLVGINNFESGRRVAAHLLEIGAKRIRFLTWNNCANSVRNRISGARSVVPGRGEVELTLNPKDERSVRRVFSGRSAPDAVICGNDAMAAHLAIALREFGRRIPEDVKIVGFDDVQYATIVEPQLTTIHQPCADIARTAFKLLLERIATPNLPPRECFLNAPLMVRGSTVRN